MGWLNRARAWFSREPDVQDDYAPDPPQELPPAVIAELKAEPVKVKPKVTPKVAAAKKATNKKASKKKR